MSMIWKFFLGNLFIFITRFSFWSADFGYDRKYSDGGITESQLSMTNTLILVYSYTIECVLKDFYSTSSKRRFFMRPH